ncbi:MAG: phosphoribosyltransferase family protein, partial [Paracoccaceae bacterium]
LGDHPPEPLAGRTVIVVDDGIATGATVKAALKGLRRRAPAEIWLAVPVAPREALAGIMGLVDRLICLEQPAQFYAVGAHYRRFDQVSDEEVSRTLAAFRNEPKPREA